MSKFQFAVTFAFLLIANHPSFGLVGGVPAKQPRLDQVEVTSVESGLFPGVVLIGDCTATKIGKFHFLLAAHCVVNRGLNREDDQSYNNKTLREYTSGHEIKIDRRVKHDSDDWTHSAKVIKTHVHPAYRYAWTKNEFNKPQFIPDVAVIIIDTETPLIPITKIQETPLKQEQKLVKMGYGCQSQKPSDIKNCIESGTRELKFSLTAIAPLEEKLSDYSNIFAELKGEAENLYRSRSNRELIASNYVLTLGRHHAAPPKTTEDPGDVQLASLGYSDSGGPLFSVSDGKLRVAAVNSQSLLWPEEHGTELLPVAVDLHTRPDTNALGGVYQWLTETLSASPESPELQHRGILSEVIQVSNLEKGTPITYPAGGYTLDIRRYLMEESAHFRFSLKAPGGKPCSVSLKTVIGWDTHLEDEAWWFLGENDDYFGAETKVEVLDKNVWNSSVEDVALLKSLRIELNQNENQAPTEYCLFSADIRRN